MMGSKLLVPLDGSELAEAALPWAALLARSQHLSLVLAQVVSSLRYGGSYRTDDSHRQHLTAEGKAAAVYLASRAGQFVTGKLLEVDGGIQEPILDLGLPDLA